MIQTSMKYDGFVSKGGRIVCQRCGCWLRALVMAASGMPEDYKEAIGVMRLEALLSLACHAGKQVMSLFQARLNVFWFSQPRPAIRPGDWPSPQQVLGFIQR